MLPTCLILVAVAGAVAGWPASGTGREAVRSCLRRPLCFAPAELVFFLEAAVPSLPQELSKPLFRVQGPGMVVEPGVSDLCLPIAHAPAAGLSFGSFAGIGAPGCRRSRCSRGGTALAVYWAGA